MIRETIAVVIAVLITSMSTPALFHGTEHNAWERQAIDAPAFSTDPQSENALQVEQRTVGYQPVNAGETLTLSYRILNTSDRTIASVQIDDPIMGTVPILCSTLHPGYSAEISCQFVMDALQKHSNPVLTYQFEGDTVSYTIKLEPADFYAEAGITAALQVTPIVYAGERVDFNYTLVNATDMSFTDIRIADEVLGDIETNLSLNPGNTYHGTKSVTITDTVTFRLAVTGTDTEGNNITFMSNEATVQTADRAE